MKRLPVLAAVLLALLAMPVAASAAGDDPLLSGYGGPGSGDQAVLGGGLVGGSGPAGGGASRSLRATTPSAPAPTAAPNATGAGSGGQGGKRHRRSGAPSSTGTTGHPETAATGTSNLAPLASIPTDADRSSAGALPLSTSDLLLALVVALAIGALAVATRRLSRGFTGTGDSAV